MKFLRTAVSAAVVIALCLLCVSADTPASETDTAKTVQNPHHHTFGPGDVVLRRPIIITKTQGASIQGMGRSISSSPGWKQTGTRLIWNGTEPAIQIIGAGAVHISDLTIVAPNARAGISFEYLKGFGTSGHVIERVTVQKAKAAFEFGRAKEDHNCDTTSLRDVAALECEAAIRINNDQAVGFRVDGLTANFCQTVFDFQHGGHLTANGVWTYQCDSIVNLGIGGVNVIPILIQGGRFDGGLKHWVTSDPGRAYTVIFDACAEVANLKVDYPRFDIGPGSKIVLRGSSYVAGDGDKRANLQDGGGYPAGTLVTQD